VSWIDQGRQYHGYFGHGTAPPTDEDDVEDAANGAVGLLPPADRIRYEHWLRGGGMATLQCAAPVLFGPDGIAAISGSGPCAAGLAKAIRANGLDRWPRVVAAMAEEASAEPEVTLPPGHYFAPLVSLMNRILAVRPGDDVSALRHEISEAFHAKGDTIGGNQVNALLSDMTEDGANLAARRAVADELAHYARTDPEQVAQFRAGLVGGVLAATTAATAEGLAARAEAERNGAVVLRRGVPEQTSQTTQSDVQPSDDVGNVRSSATEGEPAVEAAPPVRGGLGRQARVAADRRIHILDGDERGGGHRPGTGRLGKSEFPAGWSDDKIIDSIESVANDPASTRELQANGRIRVEGTQDGVRIRVIIIPDKMSIVTAHPTNMPGNP
jgi:hypothetical protein